MTQRLMPSELAVDEVHHLVVSTLVFAVYLEFLQALVVHPVEQGSDCVQDGVLGQAQRLLKYADFNSDATSRKLAEERSQSLQSRIEVVKVFSGLRRCDCQNEAPWLLQVLQAGHRVFVQNRQEDERSVGGPVDQPREG